MSSLRDQLLKSGVVSQKQAKKAEQEVKSKTHQQHKQKKKKKKSGQVEAADTESAAYLAAKAEEQEKARAIELNRQKQAEHRQKELQAQVRDLIESNHVNDSKAALTYHFTKKGKFVTKIPVNEEQRKQLINGQLAIATLEEDSYYLVSADIAEKILERMPEVVVCFNKADEKTADADDPYADYQVPDDLMW